MSNVALGARLSALFPTLDCDIYLKEINSPNHRVHERSWKSGDLRKWLSDIYYEETLQDAALTRAITDASTRLRPIIHNGNEVGLGAISYEELGAPIRSLSGISDDIGIGPRHSDDPFFGYLDAQPSRAARDQSEFVSPRAAIDAWATEQASLIEADLHRA